MTSPEIAHMVRNYFESFGPLPDLEWQVFRSKLTIRSYNTGDFFQRVAEDPIHLGLVVSGLFRVYYQNIEGKEFTRAFADEWKPIGDYASFLEAVKANVNIVALEPSKVAAIKFDDYFAMFDRHPCWDRIARKIIESFYVRRERREAEFAMMTAGQRFEIFFQTCPDIAARTSNLLIANYLGITPETLSRLKKARASSHFDS